jgi:MFS family permease
MGVGLLLAIDTRILPLAMAFFFVHEAARSLFEPIRDAYLNDNISEGERATISSFESVPRHLGGMIGLMSGGIIAQHFTIPVAWTISAMILIVSGIVLWKNGSSK